MRQDYSDILTRILEPPSWYDENGTPRYGLFSPDLCPNIYADQVILLKICCQSCHKEFLVEMNQKELDIFSILRGIEYKPWDLKSLPHYGDPPIHGCVGDTMNCEDIEIIKLYQRTELLRWEEIK